MDALTIWQMRMSCIKKIMNDFKNGAPFLQKNTAEGYVALVCKPWPTVVHFMALCNSLYSFLHNVVSTGITSFQMLL